MKYLLLLLVPFFLFNCSQDEIQVIKGDFEFISEYSALVTVGGIVGVRERTFEIGEMYKGVDIEEDSITIRIAEHTRLNDDCPNTSCYQEFLEVPRDFLKLVK
ncbi:hypothetical protein QYS49_08315 [Marivirga salinae]|uniref:Uncharacterized protein n=1 Tax=Marivirga salinarum TaxID=3059078 RepID=A0AA49JBY9_9BACT|nr:hypothetical protein [Marivirga sp. BDSF4-3]WKK77190.2 hypothetical protein QYS49_08315 [Marivirga sp. BDSF4-3]